MTSCYALFLGSCFVYPVDVWQMIYTLVIRSVLVLSLLQMPQQSSTRDPNAGSSHAASATVTITRDPNAGSSHISWTTVTITIDPNAGSSHVAWTTATITRELLNVVFVPNYIQ